DYVGTDVEISEVLHVAGEKRRHQRVSRICSTGYIPLPRSLTRRSRTTERSESVSEEAEYILYYISC
ncbi:hypothetical protein, partial [Escherichia coli]|uniref:hypothetical protein n=1 Tax=Escherichia coli TaxID=562 RepID=UPI00195D82EC